MEQIAHMATLFFCVVGFIWISCRENYWNIRQHLDEQNALKKGVVTKNITLIDLMEPILNLDILLVGVAVLSR